MRKISKIPNYSHQKTQFFHQTSKLKIISLSVNIKRHKKDFLIKFSLEGFLIQNTFNYKILIGLIFVWTEISLNSRQKNFFFASSTNRMKY